MSSRRSVADYIIACLACTDIWRSEQTSQSDIELAFKHFEAWVMEAYQRQQPPQPVTDLMQLLVHPNDHTGYTQAALKDMLRHRSNGRDFRIALSAHGSDDNDNRVRHLLLALLQAKKSRGDFSFTITSLQCQFFGDRIGIVTCPSSGRGPFRTMPCTRFEQLLFLAAMPHLSAIVKSRSVLRKRKCPGDRQLPNIPNLKRLSGKEAQCVGFAIQRIVSGWNCMAQHLGFRDTEHMVAPYTRVTRPPVLFEVVKDRTEGFVPSSQATNLEMEVKLTQRREETFPTAFDFPVVLDKNIRAIVDEFFNDFYSIIEADALYASKTKPWEELQHYAKLKNEPLPKRFTRFSKTLVNNIRKGMQDGNWLQRELQTPASSQAAPPAPSSTPPPSTPQVAPLPPLTDQELNEHMKTLENAMRDYIRLIRCSFDDVIEYHDMLFNENVEEQAQLLLMDPPYNIRRTRGDDNASHDLLTKEQMRDLVETSAKLLKPGGYIILFCTIQQYHRWERLFEEHKTERKKTFVVSRTPIIFGWHPSVNKQFPGRRSFMLLNSAEFAIHVRKNGQSKEEGENKVEYKNFNFVASDYPAYKNIITNIRGLLPGEQVRVAKAGGTGTTALRPEQKPVALLKQMIAQFTEPGDLVGDLVGGTYSAGMASFDIEEHRRFLGCEFDHVCHEHAANHIIRRLATAIAEGTTDMSFSDEVRHAAVQIHTRYMVRRIHDKNWTAPEDSPQYQSLPEHIVSFLASSSRDLSFFMNYKDRAVHDWPRTMQGFLQQMEVETLRNVDAASCGLVVAPSRIKHKNAGLGVFAAKTFVPGDDIGSFFGTLVYHSLDKRNMDCQKTYGKGVLGVTVKRFTKYAIQVPVDAFAFPQVKDLLDGKKAVSVVPAAFSACGYINDQRYLKDDEEKEAAESGAVRMRKASVIFDNDPDPVSVPIDLIPFSLQAVKAKTYINPGDELYIDYGADDTLLEIEP